MQEFDAMIMPTTKIVAPLLSESSTQEGFIAKTVLLAGNTGIATFLTFAQFRYPYREQEDCPWDLC
jgi:hypothetical protein